MTKLNIKAFGLSCGMLWGLAMFLLGIINTYFNWGMDWVRLMSSIYIGYKPTLLGSVLGGIWGFFDAGVGGLVLAWIYNKFQK